MGFRIKDIGLSDQIYADKTGSGASINGISVMMHVHDKEQTPELVEFLRTSDLPEDMVLLADMEKGTVIAGMSGKNELVVSQAELAERMGAFLDFLEQEKLAPKPAVDILRKRSTEAGEVTDWRSMGEKYRQKVARVDKTGRER